MPRIDELIGAKPNSYIPEKYREKRKTDGEANKALILKYVKDHPGERMDFKQAAAETGLTKVNAVYHLMTLFKMGKVSREKDGTTFRYWPGRQGRTQTQENMRKNGPVVVRQPAVAVPRKELKDLKVEAFDWIAAHEMVDNIKYSERVKGIVEFIAAMESKLNAATTHQFFDQQTIREGREDIGTGN